MQGESLDRAGGGGAQALARALANPFSAVREAAQDWRRNSSTEALARALTSPQGFGLHPLPRGRVARALAEAARVTRPGGFLFVFDYERTDGDNAAAEALAAARWHPRATLRAVATAAGWGDGWALTPPGDDAFLREQCADTPGFYEAVWAGTRPIIWRLTR